MKKTRRDKIQPTELIIFDCDGVLVGARVAGMTVLGFYGGSHCRPGYAEILRRAGAELTFDDMRQLPDLLRRAEADAAVG